MAVNSMFEFDLPCLHLVSTSWADWKVGSLNLGCSSLTKYR